MHVSDVHILLCRIVEIPVGPGLDVNILVSVRALD